MVAVLYQSQREQFVDSAGKPIVGGKLYVGQPNQDPKANPKTVYAERALATPLSQPIPLDANGRTQVPVWVGGSYSYVVDDTDDQQVVTEAMIEVLDVATMISEAVNEAAATFNSGIANILPTGGHQVALNTSAALGGAFQEGSVSRTKAMGTNVLAGTITQGVDRDFTFSGCHMLLSGVSLAGPSDYIEILEPLVSSNAARLIDQPATFSCLVDHNAGIDRDFRIQVGRLNAIDDFSAWTVIATGTAQAVPSGTATRLTLTVPDMGACGNGVVMIVRGSMGQITTKNIRLGESQIEHGTERTVFAMLPYEVVEAGVVSVRRNLPDGTRATTQSRTNSSTLLATTAHVAGRAATAAEVKAASANDVFLTPSNLGNHNGVPKAIVTCTSSGKQIDVFGNVTNDNYTKDIGANQVTLRLSFSGLPDFESSPRNFAVLASGGDIGSFGEATRVDNNTLDLTFKYWDNVTGDASDSWFTPTIMLFMKQ